MHEGRVEAVTWERAGRILPRRLRMGAEPDGDAHVSFRVWAPAHRDVFVVVDGRESRLRTAPDGYFEGVTEGRAGSRYGYRLGSDSRLYPDPASRFQPAGPDDLSMVVDPNTFMWSDQTWQGIQLADQVLYELHVGTFTHEGTWSAAREHLAALQDVGITTLELMPVAEFGGNFGWGYDGVGWFAPSHLYGSPDDFRQFVNDAHHLGLGVILDVVYNHLGPEGNYLGTYTPSYFSTQYKTEWGAALNFDGPESEPVREFVLSNVAYWIREFHVDGFRLDATDQIFDASEEHLIAALSRRAREAAKPRSIIVLAENESQNAHLMRSPEAGGCGLDGLYNEDFHHASHVALQGVREAYFTDYEGSARELLAAAKWGYLFQGQWYSWQSQHRGRPALDVSKERFVCFLENHDQVANSATGRRMASVSHPGQCRALTALLLLMPSTPLLFQGQELGSERPFLYFADHQPELAEKVREGRLDFLSQFRRFGDKAIIERQLAPHDRRTFEICKLDHHLDARGRMFLDLHKDLLALRRSLFSSEHRCTLDGAVLNDRALVLRYRREAGDDCLLGINLGPDVNLATVSEPLVAPPDEARWRILWSSEDPRYGGSGTPQLTDDLWCLPGNAALLLGRVPSSKRKVQGSK